MGGSEQHGGADPLGKVAELGDGPSYGDDDDRDDNGEPHGRSSPSPAPWKAANTPAPWKIPAAPDNHQEASGGEEEGWGSPDEEIDGTAASDRRRGR